MAVKTSKEKVPTVSVNEDRTSYKVSKHDRGIIYPEVDPNFYVDREHALVLKVLMEMSLVSPINLLFTGPQGCGKTELLVWLAARYKRPALMMNCASIRETKDWFGYKDVDDSGVVWRSSDFVRAVEKGDVVIIL
ncbi:MAG: AAA family ATPase, partial [Candidatus Thorarchaeota archaeon]